MRIIFAQRLRYLRIVERILREFPGRARCSGTGNFCFNAAKKQHFPGKKVCAKKLVNCKS